MKYNLADYIVSIQANDESLRNLFQNVSIGGEGSAIGSISSETTEQMFTTKGYPTGAWVHNKNLSKVGTVTLEISQLSDKIAKLKQMLNVFYGGDYNGFTISLTDSTGAKVFTAIDCYITKVPAQAFGNEEVTQQWTFTCGEIVYD